MHGRRFSKTSLFALGIVGLIGLGGLVHADPISLSTVEGDSEFGAETDIYISPTLVKPAITQRQDVPVTSLPYSGSANTAYESDSSTTTANLSSSKFSFGFTQSVTDYDTQIGGNTGGYGDMYFVANTATSYSITGGLQFTVDAEQGVDVPPGANLYTYLYDYTAGAYVYEYANETLGGSLGLSDSDAYVSGLATGNLVAGDEYEYYVAENINADEDPSLTGSGSISFGPQVTPPGGGSSAPLPTALPAGLLAVAIMGAVIRRSRPLVS